MTEAELLEYSRPVVDVYTAMEHDLMVAVAAQIAKDGFVSATSKWRMQKLAEAGELNRTAVNIIASYTGIQSDVLTEAITSAAYDVIDNIEPALQAAARDGVISDADVSASASAKRVISTYHKQAKSDLNLVNTVMRYKAKEAYVDLVNRTYDAVNAIEDVPNRQELLNTLGKHTMSAVTGAESRSAAVRKCIQEFNAKGIPAFVDAAGRQWSPEAYVNMDIKTTVSNVAHAAQDARCDEYGIDLIEVSSHKGARPKCAPYQGRIFSRSNKSGIAHDGSGREIQYSPLSETSYGEPDGLFGINCHHKKYPFIDGVNFQRYFPYEKDENDAYYAALQKQRQLERRIREQKREIDMLKEVGDDEGVKAARAKLREQQAKYKEFSEKNDLAMRKSRTAVSRKNAQKPLDSGGVSGIMKSKGYDFLDGVLGSNTIPKEQLQNLDEIVSVIPKKHLDVIGKTVKEVEIVPNIGACNYNPVTKKLTLDPDKMNGSIIHEFGHVLADAYDIYNDKEFLDILADGLDLDNGFDVKSYYFEAQNLRLYWISNPKFINDYQGRIYVDDDGFDYTAPIKPEQLKEYISVAFDAYFNNPELLKGKDKRLFDYLERMMNNV